MSEESFVTFENVSETGQGGSAVWTVPNGLKCLEGHFPGRPILPAVEVIDISLSLIRQVTGDLTIELREVANAKFLSPIEPGNRVILEATRKGNEPIWKVSWKRRDAEGASQSVAELVLGV